MIDPLKQTATVAATPATSAAAIKSLTTTSTATPAVPKTNGLAAAAGLTTPKVPVTGALNDSVADKVKELTSQDSPLMQQAKTDALKVANRRGLLNSSMAVGAAQDATVRAALPIASQDASQAFQKNMQGSDQAWKSGESALDRTSTEGMAKAQRDLQEKMQNVGIDADKQTQIRDIASREGLAAAERALQQAMQSTDIASREGLAQQERTLQWEMQNREIGYQTGQRGADRALQEQLASWNLKSADRNAASQFITNMESMFQESYSSIMANTNLDAPTREAQIVSARNLRDRQMNMVRQMYNVALTW